MRKSVEEKLKLLKSKEYVSNRTDCSVNVTVENCSEIKVNALRFINTLKNEKPVFIGENDLFGFNRYQKKIGTVNGEEYVLFGNISPDYPYFLANGLNGIKQRILNRYKTCDDKAKEFYDTALDCLKAIEEKVIEVKNQALITGNVKLYSGIDCIFNGAKDYYEGLICLHFIQYILRLNGNNHIGLARFDKYMKPYYDISKKQGLTDDDILELTELFYISMNFDSDLYPGVQQGDNGQSIVFGGIDESGKDVFSSLSEIGLKASEELRLIDPKINLRVSKNTPLKIYELGTKLTKQGLGFPQYSNDDIVIDSLVNLGYDYNDAVNYVVAACWEFIIPGGADVPNISTMNFPKIVDVATKKYFLTCNTFEEFLEKVKYELIDETNAIIKNCNQKTEREDALISLFLDTCIEKGRDVANLGSKYNNYGIHGAGISNGADSLTAIKKIFEEKPFTKEVALKALENDFKGYEDIQKTLLSYPKMGNNDQEADGMATFLMEIFSQNLNGKPNNRGGVFRAGTGSAMDYIFQARLVPATLDGRNNFKPFASSFSPSITARINGPLSAVQSFTGFDMKKICNGGPFTIEIHDTVFRNEEGEKKVSMLIKTFIDLGGHQIQINSINRDVLLDAQVHPENYPNLIVRVWGWSGYFTELIPEFQNHIIKRVEFTF